jgi:mRNA-degrading endonuclease toxin of MazEF toxin-antitoxin module
MPSGNLTYRRGEIRWVRLAPTVGAEIQKTRSCLIIQNDIMNQYGLLTVAIPFRPGSKQAPYVVNVKASSTNGLDRDRNSNIYTKSRTTLVRLSLLYPKRDRVSIHVMNGDRDIHLYLTKKASAN